MNKHHKPKVLVVGTGGTIGARKVGGYLRYGEIIQEELLTLVPEVKDHVDVTATNLFRLHSADMHPENWVSLAQFISYYLDDVDGVVVTHGEDTMAYTAAAMGFMIQNLNIPIVFTGAQSIPQMIGSDARVNLVDAIRVAASADLAESVIVFDRKIIRGVRAKKLSASQYHAFDSGSQKRLGILQQEILLEGFQKRRDKKRKPTVYTNIEPNVGIVKMRPGIRPAQLEYLMNTGLKGIILEGYGLGNIPMGKDNMKQAINDIVASGIPVALTSENEFGVGWQNIYNQEVEERLRGTNILECYDMLTETALVKMMWVLGQTRKIEKIYKMMQHNYLGEISKDCSVLGRAGMWERKI